MPTLGLRRLLTALAVVLIAVAQMQAVALDLRAHARLRDRAAAQSRQLLRAHHDRIEAAAARGGPDALQAAASIAVAACDASEAEIFDLQGRALAASPRAAPVSHWPGAREMPTSGGPPLVVGPTGTTGSRLLAYDSLAAGPRVVLLRVSWVVPDVVEDMRERRVLWVLEALAFAGLLVGGVLLLSPSRGARADEAPGGALHAYEQAVERLRDRGDALRRQHDVERREMEDRIEDREAMARAGELTAGMVHEVRNGLGTIVGYARLVERDPAGAAEAAARIREECETLEVVVRRFMDFVRRESLDVTRFDLGRLVQRVVARETRGHGGGEVSAAGPPDATMEGDEELLERALENIVRNALDASGEAGRVLVEWGVRDGVARIAVADEGAGRAATLRASLRPFFSTTPGGLGLGLPLAIKIAALHGGRVDFVDRAPRGLTVVLELPVAVSA